MFISAQTGDLYEAPSGGVPGDREATADEVLAWQQGRITIDAVKAECARRIYGSCSAASQSNINGYLNLLNSTAISGTPLTDAQKADIAIFGKAMAWINAMRGACAGLVGNLAYTNDTSWPALPDDVAAFAARF